MTLNNVLKLGTYVLAFIDSLDHEKAKMFIKEFEETIFFLEKTYGCLENQMSANDYKFVSVVYEAISKYERSGCSHFN